MYSKTLFVVFLWAVASCGMQQVNAQSLREQCKGVEFDMLPYPDVNTKFVVCIFGNPEVRECGTQTCFDASLKSCTADACIQTVPGDKAIAVQYCRGLPPMQKIPSVDCGHFYICLGDIEPIYVECPSGMHYSKFDQQCTSPVLAKCMAEEKLCTVDDNKPIFAGEHCNEYYICKNKQLVKKTCAYGQAYSTQVESCLSDLSCVTDAKPDCTDANNINAYFAHADCSKFYVCIQKELYEGKCATGYGFDSKTSSCTLGACEHRIN